MVYLNPFAESLFGTLEKSSASVQGGIANWIESADRDRALAALQQVLEGVQLHDFEFSVVGRDRMRHWLLCNARRRDDNEGQPAVLLTAHDITARRDAEQGLTLLNAAIANLEEGVLLTRAEGSWLNSRVVYVNAALCRMMHCESQRLMSATPRLFMDLSSNAVLLEQLNEAIAAGRSFTGECLARCGDGGEFPIEVHLSHVTDANGLRTHVVSTIRDITERRAGEERLLRSERLSVIGKAMTGLAHESRNALQRAQASLDMLAVDLEGDEQATKLITRIQVAQSDLHRLYEDVREYARPLRFELRSHRVDELLRQAWDELIVKRAGYETSLADITQTNDLTCHLSRGALCPAAGVSQSARQFTGSL